MGLATILLLLFGLLLAGLVYAFVNATAGPRRARVATVAALLFAIAIWLALERWAFPLLRQLG